MGRAGSTIHWRTRLAAHWMRCGGVVAYPTEAVYGLGCDPWNPEAVTRLLGIKQRTMEKGLVLIGADTGQLRPFLGRVSDEVMQRVTATWPGPFTWLLPAHPGVPVWVRGHHAQVAVRVTAHPVAAQLCRAFGGAIVSTSANRSGRPPCRTLLRVRQQLGESIDGWIGGRVGDSGRPTPIRDAVSGDLVRPA